MKVGKKIDPEHVEMVVEMTRAGLPTAVIAERLKCSDRTVTRYRVRAGIAKPGNTRLSEEQRRMARALYEDECPINEIARTLGCGHGAVDKLFRNDQNRRNRSHFRLSKQHQEMAHALKLTLK